MTLPSEKEALVVVVVVRIYRVVSVILSNIMLMLSILSTAFCFGLSCKLFVMLSICFNFYCYLCSLVDL